MSYSDKNAPEDFKELKESVSDNIEKLKTETKTVKTHFL